METRETLFDDLVLSDGSVPAPGFKRSTTTKEGLPLDRLKNLEDKINNAVEKVRTLKEEKAVYEKRIRDLEAILEDRDREIQELKAEKGSIGSQIQELLKELDTIEA